MQSDNPITTKFFLSEAELAERWRLSPRTLQRWRRQRKGPAFFHIGRRVLYLLRDVAEFEDGGRTEVQP